jgi:hypothetical protein
MIDYGHTLSATLQHAVLTEQGLLHHGGVADTKENHVGLTGYFRRRGAGDASRFGN